MNKSINKDAFDRSYEGYLEKLRKWAQEAPSFDRFIERVKSFPNWFHGNPMLPEFTRWTLVDYQKFYEENQ